MRRLILLFSAFLAGNLYAGQLQSERYFENNGGKFDHISPLLVPTKNAGDIVNFTLDDRGQLSKRLGYTVIQSTTVFGPSTWTVTGMGYHTSTTGAPFFGVVAGTDVFRIGNTFSSYSKVTGTVTITMDNYNLDQVTSLNDKLLFCNEDDQPFYLGSSGNAVAVTTSTFQAAKSCTAYGNYIIVGNTTESSVSYPSRVRWSDVNTINSYPILNYIDVEPDDGDKIVSMAQYEDSVYIFKRHNIYRMLITGSSGPDAFIIRPVVRNVGCWAKNSVKTIPGIGLVFLSQNTLYTLNGSYAAQYSEQGLRPIGDPIQRTFDATDRTQWTYSVGEVFPKRYQYWICMSTANSQNNECLVYDYVQGAWTTYTGLNVSALSQADDSTGNSVLITGDNHNTTYEQDQGTLDNPRGVQTTISASYTTPDFNLSTPEITKGFKYLYLYTNVYSTSTLNISAAYDLSSAYEFNTTLNLSLASALYDVDLYNQAVYPGLATRIIRLELNKMARLIRLQFTNTDNFSSTGAVIGWVLVYDLENYSQ